MTENTQAVSGLPRKSKNKETKTAEGMSKVLRRQLEVLTDVKWENLPPKIMTEFIK